MTPFAFDTLNAAKRLREAGMAEGVAEAVVSVFQHAAEMPDIGHLATKEDLDALRLDLGALRLATKEDIDALRSATKEDLDALRSATKEDLDALRLATKEGLDALRLGTKADLDGLRTGTKADLAILKNEMSADLKVEAANFRADFNDKFRQQNWTMLGGMAVLLAITTGASKLLG